MTGRRSWFRSEDAMDVRVVATSSVSESFEDDLTGTGYGCWRS